MATAWLRTYAPRSACTAVSALHERFSDQCVDFYLLTYLWASFCDLIPQERWQDNPKLLLSKAPERCSWSSYSRPGPTRVGAEVLYATATDEQRR